MRLKALCRLGPAVVVLLAAQARAESSAKITCWNDDRGVRACGDHVPPEYAKKTQQIYDNRGVLVKIIQGEKTPEERAAEEQKARAEKFAHEQQAHDTFLLQSYGTVTDLEHERDSRLASIETRLELAEKAVADGDAQLTDLRDRATEASAAGKEPDPALDKQIQEFEAAHADNVRAVTELQQKRDALAAQYEHDIQRFLVLSNAAPGTPQAH